MKSEMATETVTVTNGTSSAEKAAPFVGERSKVSSHISQNEGLIFEKSSPGKTAYRLPPLDVPAIDPHLVLGEYVRENLGLLPEVSEIEIIRHFTRLSTWNYAIDLGMYPLGSCTMKYNPRVNELVARLEGIADAHPYQPESLAQGAMRVMWMLQECLKEITGMDAITLQPAAGAHGEFTGILLVRAYHESKGNPRKKILIPDSAHGTNPATAAICGYQVQNLKSNSDGMVDLAELEQLVDEETAALMLTNPSTIGVFESEIHNIADVLHSKGALLYMDGANMNALVGKTRPGDFGVDVMHLNLHKTFSTPHGGGGPGSGPVACKNILEPFLPTPVLVEKPDNTLTFNYDRPQSVGRVRMFYGNYGMFVRALAYILANGPDGLRQTTEDAVLNANYIRAKLEDVYELPYKTPTLHEVVFSDRRQTRNGVKTGDIAKRLIDYGFHPYTTSFPMIVAGALMIEPTESESKEELDQFIDAMRQIAREADENPEIILRAPHATRVSRMDEVTAARKPVLRWRPDAEPESAADDILGCGKNPPLVPATPAKEY
jgi:glycine dehydrogenase subunit 2